MRESEGKWLDQERKLMERRVKHQVQVCAPLYIPIAAWYGQIYLM